MMLKAETMTDKQAESYSCIISPDGTGMVLL